MTRKAFYDNQKKCRRCNLNFSLNVYRCTNCGHILATKRTQYSKGHYELKETRRVHTRI